MQFRDHPAVQGKRDMYPVDPRKLKVDEAYNVRDMQAKETRDHIAWLKASIIAGGVHTPLEVRLDGKNIFVVAGHCRLAAVLEAIEEGHPIATVPCIPEAKGTDEIDRTVNLVISNSGKPLAPLEVAKVVKRLDGYGWSAKQIAERLGWKSVASVKQHLEMLELSEGVKQQVRAGNVSATTARKLAKSDLSPEEQEALIRANEEENRRIRGTNRRTKVTPKTLKRNAPKPPGAEANPGPQSAPEPAAAAETVSGHIEVAGPLTHEQKTAIRDAFEVAHTGPHPDPSKLSALGAKFVPDTQPPDPMTAQAAEQPESSIRPDSDGEPVRFPEERTVTIERHPAISVTLPLPQGVKDLIEALAPFARIAEDYDLNQRSDDDVLEVRVGLLKRAWEVWSKATGDDVKDAA